MPEDDGLKPHRALDPGAGAVVMATGIVSIALALDHQTALSHALLVMTALTWVALALLLARQAAVNRTWLSAATRTPASLTAVAATAVLASGLEPLGFEALAVALLAVAAAVCACLAVTLVRAPTLPRSGGAFMLAVAPQSLASSAALLASTGRFAWLIFPAMALCIVGVALYLVTCARFDPRQLVTSAGDHWIAGGSLAISALSLVQISRATSRQVVLHWLGSPLADLGAAVWILSLVWLPLLLGGELAAPRLGHPFRRWSTLFPVGMYAASGFEVARTAGLSFAGTFSTGCVWVAAALWAILAAAMGRRVIRVAATS